jgi:hypothetical protein
MTWLQQDYSDIVSAWHLYMVSVTVYRWLEMPYLMGRVSEPYPSIDRSHQKQHI